MSTGLAMIGEGQVRHTRWRPRHHEFAYPTYFLWLPLHNLAQAQAQGLAINRSAWVSWHDADHGDGRTPEAGGALAWLRELLQSQGIHEPLGEVWLQCYPRVLGVAFKPVSFWHVHTAQGDLRAIVAEVNNTFGERHCYVLEHPRWGQTHTADKHFHVSPFCAVRGHYQFRFMRSHTDAGERLVVRIEHGDDEGPLLSTSVSGRLQALSPQTLRQVAGRHPWLSLGIVARIHWQALRLWLKRVPFFRKPLPPHSPVTIALVPPARSLSAETRSSS
jgi:DUF1365 family protein